VLSAGGNRVLPATALVSPTNGAVGQLLTPQLTWNSVNSALDYSVAIATSLSALPTSYTQITCPSCTYFNTSVSTSYTVPSGVLQNKTTYYWEVQADSGVYKGGDWSSPYSFTTGGNATKIQSVSVNPSSFGSGSYAVVTVTLNGIAPSSGTTVTLTSSNQTEFPLPPNIKVPAGQNTASITVLSGTAKMTTTVTVRATYNGAQTGTTTTSAAS
jgi:hypothetical protein